MNLFVDRYGGKSPLSFNLLLVKPASSNDKVADRHFQPQEPLTMLFKINTGLKINHRNDKKDSPVY